MWICGPTHLRAYSLRVFTLGVRSPGVDMLERRFWISQATHWIEGLQFGRLQSGTLERPTLHLSTQSLRNQSKLQHSPLIRRSWRSHTQKPILTLCPSPPKSTLCKLPLLVFMPMFHHLSIHTVVCSFPGPCIIFSEGWLFQPTPLGFKEFFFQPQHRSSELGRSYSSPESLS